MQVNEGSGASAGLIPADIITMLNGKKIQSVAQLLEVIKEAPVAKAIPMRIVRRGSPQFIAIKIISK